VRRSTRRALFPRALYEVTGALCFRPPDAAQLHGRFGQDGLEGEGMVEHQGSAASRRTSLTMAFVASADGCSLACRFTSEYEV
jgi:hypothetical protein